MSEAEEKAWGMKVRQALHGAKGIAWDGCHKIYILLDDEQMKEMDDYGYAEAPSQLLRIPDDIKREDALGQLKEWFEDSCFLRFINSVRTVEGDPNVGFTGLIEQFEFDEEDEDNG